MNKIEEIKQVASLFDSEALNRLAPCVILSNYKYLESFKEDYGYRAEIKTAETAFQKAITGPRFSKQEFIKDLEKFVSSLEAGLSKDLMKTIDDWVEEGVDNPWGLINNRDRIQAGIEFLGSQCPQEIIDKVEKLDKKLREELIRYSKSVRNPGPIKTGYSHLTPKTWWWNHLFD